MPQYTNLDAGETIFFNRQLEYIKPRTYDVVKSPLKAFELIPVSSEVNPGAESIVYYQYDQSGFAKIIANYADDLPRVDVHGKEFVSRIKSVGDSYGYNLQEIRAAQYAGTNLTQRKANAAAEAQRQLWNKIAFYGDKEYNLPGLLTSPNIPSASVAADGTGSTTTWSTKTPAQIVRDVSALINSVITLTGGAEQVNTVVLPLANYTLIATTKNSESSDITILEFLQKVHPGVSFEWANEITAASLAAAGVTDFTGNIMLAYNRSPDKLVLEMPQMFEQLPVQERGLEYIVPCHSRIAGVLVYYPLSMAIGEGI
ncbi:DUF2184 domain-containing protein [Rufibacter sediminis]|uniref:DUF2184 domain-containing protein n=1 Tax=Rufibacter sediminis TaxID=2762756 RepID=A0ABR6VUV6_9BACT|nr:DUF2184 domain-containing protein [Rufibacter sediminis]MBC3540652.1 DUF2184 domain-containing protein [Rufibacter sediminis]